VKTIPLGSKSTPPIRVDGLFDSLVPIRRQWGAVSPARRQFPGTCILQIDEGVSAQIVKSVFLTATLAGYPNVSFMVRPRRN
jgi:hypothetical protein